MFKTVQVDDAVLRYELRKKAGATALLLLNPLAASLEVWDAQLEELGRVFTLIRFDPRGHGESTVGTKAELTMEDLARDARAVLDAAGVERAHLCGLSIGGMTAMKMATLWPERVEKLVLCATTPYMPTAEMWQDRIGTALKDGLGALVNGTLQRWFTPQFHAARPEDVQRVRALLLKTDPRGYAASAAAIRDMDQRESIKSISAPTLVIAGALDPGVPPTQSELITGSIKGADLRVLDSAHLINVEQPAAFNSAVLEFLAGSKSQS
ncbi:MAG TPA: 3-oxoadipate enol-lactonase [Steroidobacteraceae bacterium]|nr:3-oxoadipate enol-lactonase [Steroidobacteraceae bacterium]